MKRADRYRFSVEPASRGAEIRIHVTSAKSGFEFAGRLLPSLNGWWLSTGSTDPKRLAEAIRQLGLKVHKNRADFRGVGYVWPGRRTITISDAERLAPMGWMDAKRLREAVNEVWGGPMQANSADGAP